MQQNNIFHIQYFFVALYLLLPPPSETLAPPPKFEENCSPSFQIDLAKVKSCYIFAPAGRGDSQAQKGLI